MSVRADATHLDRRRRVRPGAVFGATVLAGCALLILELLLRVRLLAGGSLPVAALAAFGLVGTAATLAGAVFAAIAWLLPVPSRRWIRRAAALAAAGLWVFSVEVMPNSYDRVHLLADLLLLAALTLAMVPIAQRAGRIPAAVGLAAVPALLVANALAPHPGVSAVRQFGFHARRIAGAVDALADRDGDRYAAAWWLGGADCDDTDPRRGPHMPEMPGNGVDENCLAGDAPPQPPDPAAPPAAGPALARNVVILSLCTFRDLPITDDPPKLSALADRALVATRNRSQSAASATSFISVFAGRFAHETLSADADGLRYEDRGRPYLLAERLHAAGFRTGFFHHGLQREAAGWRPVAGYDVDVSDPDLVGALRRWLAAPEAAPAVAWFHLNYTHAAGLALSPRTLAHQSRIERYRAARARVEQTVQALVDGLAADGRLADTAIVLFADHGEAFGEHDFYFHGLTLFDEMIRTPLMVYAPGRPPGRLEVNTSNLDVAPTVFDLLGRPIPPEYRGLSLLRPLPPGRPTVTELFSGRFRLNGRAVVDGDGRWKLVRGFDPAFEALYSLANDAGERENRILDEPSVADALRAELDLAAIARGSAP